MASSKWWGVSQSPTRELKNKIIWFNINYTGEEAAATAQSDLDIHIIVFKEDWQKFNWRFQLEHTGRLIAVYYEIKDKRKSG